MVRQNEARRVGVSSTKRARPSSRKHQLLRGRGSKSQCHHPHSLFVTFSSFLVWSLVHKTCMGGAFFFAKTKPVVPFSSRKEFFFPLKESPIPRPLPASSLFTFFFKKKIPQSPFFLFFWSFSRPYLLGLFSLSVLFSLFLYIPLKCFPQFPLNEDGTFEVKCLQVGDVGRKRSCIARHRYRDGSQRKDWWAE